MTTREPSCPRGTKFVGTWEFRLLCSGFCALGLRFKAWALGFEALRGLGSEVSASGILGFHVASAKRHGTCNGGSCEETSDKNLTSGSLNPEP